MKKCLASIVSEKNTKENHNEKIPKKKKKWWYHYIPEWLQTLRSENKYCQGYGTIGLLTYYLCENVNCYIHFGMPSGSTVLLVKLKTDILHDPAIPPPGIYPTEFMHMCTKRHI